VSCNSRSRFQASTAEFPEVSIFVPGPTKSCNPRSRLAENKSFRSQEGQTQNNPTHVSFETATEEDMRCALDVVGCQISCLWKHDIVASWSDDAIVRLAYLENLVRGTKRVFLLAHVCLER
jgi:hypothetical protein